MEETLQSSVPDLAHIGWDEAYQAQLEELFPGLDPARVAVEHGSAYSLFSAEGEVAGVTTGKLRHDSLLRTELPVVGDWVAVRPLPGEPRAVIEGVLPRRSAFSRDVAGRTTEQQILAANVDKLFVVSGLDGDLNVRRVERFLTLAWESGATPVCVLTKTDKCPDLAAALEEVERVSPGVEIYPVCGLDRTGLDALRSELQSGPTIALLGSSGVGKSTLINLFLEADAMVTRKVRWDGRGRHTTTHRELFPLPGGGALIDTPGLRELRLWDADAGIEESFSDIARLAEGCRFNDCTHEHEPACALLGALEDGSLSEDRLAGYRKLKRELAALERKKDVHLAREQNRKWKKLTAEARTKSRAKERF
jgi:ribosome biogenesis GTPase / thiamine phosphate phosphatase